MNRPQQQSAVAAPGNVIFLPQIHSYTKIASKPFVSAVFLGPTSIKETERKQWPIFAEPNHALHCYTSAFELIVNILLP